MSVPPIANSEIWRLWTEQSVLSSKAQTEHLYLEAPLRIIGGFINGWRWQNEWLVTGCNNDRVSLVHLDYLVDILMRGARHRACGESGPKVIWVSSTLLNFRSACWPHSEASTLDRLHRWRHEVRKAEMQVGHIYAKRKNSETEDEKTEVIISNMRCASVLIRRGYTRDSEMIRRPYVSWAEGTSSDIYHGCAREGPFIYGSCFHWQDSMKHSNRLSKQTHSQHSLAKQNPKKRSRSASTTDVEVPKRWTWSAVNKHSTTL